MAETPSRRQRTQSSRSRRQTTNITTAIPKPTLRRSTRKSTSALPPLPSRPTPSLNDSARKSSRKSVRKKPELQNAAVQKSSSKKKRSLPATTQKASPKKPRKRAPKPASYKQIDVNLSEERRLQSFVALLLKEEYEQKHAKASASEREQFERGMLAVSNYLSEFAAKMEESEDSVARKTDPNPMDDELRRRVSQLEEVVKNYDLELQKWKEVEENISSCKPQVPALPSELDRETREQLPDPQQLLDSSKEVVENYILETDSVRHKLKGLRQRNRSLHSRVQAVAAALNNEVVSEFGKRDELDDLAPPPNLVTMSVDAGRD